MELTFGKYKGKTLEEVAKEDVHYLIWLYWETFHKHFDGWFEKMGEIEKAIKSVGHTVHDKKKELLETVKFGKHKGKKFEDLIKKEAKWFLWMLGEAKDSRTPNHSLIFTLEYWLKKNGCILFNESEPGLQHCHCCGSMHTIKK